MRRQSGIFALGFALALFAGSYFALAMAAPGGGKVSVAPPNDNFANRVAISGSTGSTTGTNVDATSEAGEPWHEEPTALVNPGTASVWWTWTAPGTGPVSFSTYGSDFDTILAVYTGPAVDDLTLVASADDQTRAAKSDPGWSLLRFQAVKNTVYQVAVDGFYGNTGSEEGSIALAWTMESRPLVGSGTIGDPYQVDVTDGGLFDVTNDDVDDWIEIHAGAGCYAMEVTLSHNGGDDQMFMQIFDPRCPANGPGAFPRLIAGNYTRGDAKSIVVVDQAGLNPVLVRVYPEVPNTAISYNLNYSMLPNPDDAREEDDLPAGLTPIERSEHWTVKDLILRDEDWFVIDAQAGESIGAQIKFNEFSGDLNLQLYDLENYPGFGFPTELITYSYGFDGTESVYYTAPANKQLGLRAYGERLSTNIYDVNVWRTGGASPPPAGTFEAQAGWEGGFADAFDRGDLETLEYVAGGQAAAVIDDASDAYEPNQTLDQALANAVIAGGTSEFDAVCDDEDWYAIEQELCGTLVVVVEFDADAAVDDLAIQFFSEICPPNGAGAYPRMTAANYNHQGGVLMLTSLDRFGEPFQFLRVYRLSENGGGVPYTVRLVQGALDDVLEDNDYNWQATALTPSVGADATITELILRDEDWYEVPVAAGQTVTMTIEFSHDSGDLNVQLYEQNEGTAWPSNLLTSSYGFGNSETVSYTASGGVSKVVLRVYGERNSTNTYRLIHRID